MFDPFNIFFSPSGRFACRYKYRGDHEEKRTEVLFFDLQEEVCYEIVMVIVGEYSIHNLYWVDDSHIVVLFMQSHDDAANNKKVINIPKRTLYAVDLNKKELEPIKIQYWREEEDVFPTTGWYDYINGFLTVNNHEYLVYTNNKYDELIDDIDKTYNDLEHNKMFNGNKNDFTWLRFIPKEFKNEEEIEKTWINHGEALRDANIPPQEREGFSEVTAHRGKLYFFSYSDHVLVMDVEKYLNVLKISSTTPASSEFCITIKLVGSMPYERAYFHQNGLMYLRSFDENYTIYIRIWDIDEKMVTSYYKIDKASTFDHGEMVFPNWCLHPSGKFIQIEHETGNFVSYGSLGRTRLGYVTKKSLIFNLLPLKPVRTQVDSLEQLVINQILMNKSGNQEMLPRFLKEGKRRVDIPVKKLESCNFSDLFTFINEL